MNLNIWQPNMDSDGIPNSEKVRNLWRCTCVNGGQLTEPEYHLANCNYTAWYEQQLDDNPGHDD